MATTFTLNTTSTGFPSSYPQNAVVELIVTPDIANNQSVVNWAVKIGNSGTNNVQMSSLDFRLRNTNTQLVLWDSLDSPSAEQSVWRAPGSTVTSGNFTIKHNTDGSLTLNLFFKAYMYYDSNPNDSTIGYGKIVTLGSSYYYSQALPVIPVASTVTCTTVAVGRNPTITITAPSTTFKHTLRYKFGSLSGTIASGLAAGAYNKWSIPTSFLNVIKDESYGDGTIYCDTYNSSGSLNGTTETAFRVLVPNEYGPTLAPTFKDVNSTTVALTGDSSKIVQYFSNVTYTTGAAASTGATLTSQQINCAGQTSSTASGTLTKVENNAFTITATDSRGFITSETFYVTMVPYIKLTAKLKLISIDTSGVCSISITGNLFKGSFGAVENNPVISYRWKEEGGSWSNWTETTYSITNDNYRVNLEFQGLNYQKTYIYEAKAVDSLMTVEPEQLVVKCMPVFDWDDGDFQFNVPVTINGDLVITGNITSANDPEDVVTPVDYVVETGTSDIWTYRKWDSGAAECWGTIAPTSISITGTWGSIYIKDDAIPRVYYPFEFIDVPVVSMSLYNTTGNCWSYTGTQGSALMSPAFGLARGTSGSVTTGAQITAIGRWK